LASEKSGKQKRVCRKTVKAMMKLTAFSNKRCRQNAHESCDEKDERHTHMQARLKATTRAPENHARSAKEKKMTLNARHANQSMLDNTARRSGGVSKNTPARSAENKKNTPHLSDRHPNWMIA
jgi:hypothetical protein